MKHFQGICILTNETTGLQYVISSYTALHKAHTDGKYQLKKRYPETANHDFSYETIETNFMTRELFDFGSEIIQQLGTLEPDGYNAMKGYNQGEDSFGDPYKNKISENVREKMQTPEVQAKIKAHNANPEVLSLRSKHRKEFLKNNPDILEKMAKAVSKAKKGVPLSDEQKAKLSEAGKQRWARPGEREAQAKRQSEFQARKREKKNGNESQISV